MSVWNCSLSKNAMITVGEKLTLDCEGTTQGLNQETLTIKDAQLSNEIPVLSLLSIEKFEEQKSQYTVTTYRVGDHVSDSVVFYDGKNKVTLKGFEWKVESVLKQDPLNPPQPVGAYPMWSMSYPIWFWIAVAILLAAIIGIPYAQFKKIENRKKAFDDLKNLETALNPLDSFFKSMRRMEKALDVDHVSPNGFADQLDKDFRVYLSRSLYFPAHLWTISQIFKEIRKKYPKLYRDHKDDLSKYFAEFTRTKANIQKKDCLYLLGRAQKLAEDIDTALAKKKRGRA